jgi:hypothetical protein
VRTLAGGLALAAGVILGPPRVAVAGVAGAAAEFTAAPQPTGDDVAFTRGVLLDPGTGDELRRQAVDRLARDGSAAAIDALAAALRSADPAVVSVTLQALGQTPDANEALLEPLIGPMLEALAVAPTGLLDPLGLLLARLDKADRAPVREMATDPQRPPTERLAAIHVLGVLATIESGDTLIDLADPARNEDPAIRRAAREALARMVGRDLGDDHGAWTAWWSQARRRGLADWWREIRRRDREQIARLQTELDALASRHVELLRQLYAGFNDAAPSAREIELLSAHLADPAPAVRRFALGRVERLVRDSVPIPPPLLPEITARLDDDNGPIRAAAVRLLDEAGIPALDAELITRLPSEPDPVTASAMLDVLGRSGDSAAADAIVARLDVPATAPAAARAAWMLAVADALPPEARTRAAALAEARLKSVPDAVDATRLLATIGDEAAVSSLVARLVPETGPAVTAAIAEGLASRGLLEPLLERSDLPAVRPVLVDALADGEPTETRLVRLLELEPAAEIADARRAWESAVARLARRLPPFGVLTIDATMAEAAGPAAAERRRLMLVPTADAAAREGREDATEVLRAATVLLVDLGRAAEAWTLIEQAGTVGTDEKVRGPRADAAMLTGRYDEAATVDGDPDRWLATLRGVVARAESAVDAERAARASDTARRLAAEIARRFESILDETQRIELGRMLASVSSDTAAAADGGTPGS